jgi:uncharacterized protein
MSLKERIEKDLMEARKKADGELVAILKLIWSEIGYLAVDKKDSDEEITAMLKRETRKRKDAIEIYEKAGDEERAGNERYELKVISSYLPEEMGEDEVRKIVEETAKETKLSGGQLIGAAMKKLAGKADGKLVAKIAGKI